LGRRDPAAISPPLSCSGPSVPYVLGILPAILARADEVIE
jgi:hypothetical protein